MSMINNREQTDAGNGSKAIHRVRNVLRPPSADPKCSPNKPRPMPEDPNKKPTEGELLIRAGENATVDQHLKAKIASLFSADANDFLWRADVASQAEFQHRSWLGKIYVDYVMATECALKAAIIYLSPDSESPRDAYRTARSGSHDMQKLLPSAEERSRNITPFVSKECVTFLSGLPFSVTARYDLELLHAHFSTKDGYDSKVNDSIRDTDFMQRLRECAFEVVDFSRKTAKSGSNRSLPILGTKMKAIQDAFTSFKL